MSGDARVIVVAGHRFAVPAAHLVDTTPFFLPPPGEGFTALLDPQAPLPARIAIVVEPAAALCSPRTPPAIDQLPRACVVAAGGAPQPAPGRLTRALRFADDPSQFDYRGEDGGVAASCVANGDGGAACTAIYAWRDLIWSADFDEALVPRLDAIRDEVARRLDAWSADAGSAGAEPGDAGPAGG